MTLLDSLDEANKWYRESVRPDVLKGNLTQESKYHLANICTRVIGHVDDIVIYHSGANLLFDVTQIWNRLIQEKEISASLYHNLETHLAQVKLSVSTGNK